MQLIVPSDSRREHKVKYFHHKEEKEKKKASQAAKTNRWNIFKHLYRDIGLHQGRPGALNVLRIMDTKKGYLFESTVQSGEIYWFVTVLHGGHARTVPPSLQGLRWHPEHIYIYIYIYIYMCVCVIYTEYVQSNSVITSRKGVNILCRYKRVLL